MHSYIEALDFFFQKTNDFSDEACLLAGRRAAVLLRLEVHTQNSIKNRNNVEYRENKVCGEMVTKLTARCQHKRFFILVIKKGLQSAF